MPSNDLHAVSGDLDDLLIRIFEIQDELLQQRQRLNILMGSGYVNMAKARYILGSKRVSMLQVNLSETAALTKVISKETKSATKNVTFTSYDMFQNEMEKDETQIRKRGDKDEETEFEIAKTVDPIKWFGCLLPEALRNCQKEFKQATEAMLDLASLQNELQVLQAKYDELKKYKHSIRNEMPEESSTEKVI